MSDTFREDLLAEMEALQTVDAHSHTGLHSTIWMTDERGAN